jgi:hypothetical protein
MKPTPTRMYYLGPLRLFSMQPFLGSLPYSGGNLTGYAGKFVCAQCRQEVHRVMFAENDWICRDCQTTVKRAGHMVGKGTKD